MKNLWRIANGKLEATDDESSVVAVFFNPNSEEKRHLVTELQIDEHTLQSALDPDELARLEFEPNHAAMIFKRPKHYTGKDEFLFRVESAGAFLFSDRLVVVANEETPLFDRGRAPKLLSPRAVMLQLLYRSIFHFREHLKVISMISDDLQNKINKAMENRSLLNLFTLQKSLVYYLNSINSNGALIDKIKHARDRLGFSPEEMETLDDISVENSQCYRQAEIYSNILVSLMDARASIVSNNLNVLMKNLTLITIGIMVPTFVVSAFSMNVRIPLAQYHWAFWFIMLLAFLSVTAFTLIFKNRR
ncbi:magnesium transporter CorA family protein [Candidatus Sumerlaeota bacterium]|nr:magnesium transporter CorA family protein [Candidatus Sumerlaeota bacterium]